jgi:thiamine-phosphate pyrophosphorylase
VRGLYAIVDLDALRARGLEPIRFARALLVARPVALQLRAKNDAPEGVIELLRALKPFCSDANVPLVANDRPDHALLSGADMVHVGQTDASPSLVRALAPKMAFGVSTHTPEQLSKALRSTPAYIAYGPVWSTRSKLAADPAVGVAGLKQAARLLRIHAKETGASPPLVAIGGITLDRVMEISGYASAVAVISDLVPPTDLEGDSAYDYVRARAEHYTLALEDPARLDRLSIVDGA